MRRRMILTSNKKTKNKTAGVCSKGITSFQTGTPSLTISTSFCPVQALPSPSTALR